MPTAGGFTSTKVAYPVRVHRFDENGRDATGPRQGGEDNGMIRAPAEHPRLHGRVEVAPGISALSIILEVLLKLYPNGDECLLRLFPEQGSRCCPDAFLAAQGVVEGEVYFGPSILDTLDRWLWNAGVHLVPLIAGSLSGSSSRARLVPVLEAPRLSPSPEKHGSEDGSLNHIPLGCV